MKKYGITKENDDMLNVVADEWKKLSTKDRAHWDEESRNDKVRYVHEKAAWRGPSLVPKRRAKKNPLAPKRPMSAFLKFSQKRRQKVKGENPHMSNTDVSRLLGEMWRNASPKEKTPYREQEEIERAIYKEEIRKFKAEQSRLESSSRSHLQPTHGNYRSSPPPTDADDLAYHARSVTSNSAHAFDTLRMDSFEEAPVGASSGRVSHYGFRHQYASPYPQHYRPVYHSPGKVIDAVILGQILKHEFSFSLYFVVGRSSSNYHVDYFAEDPLHMAPPLRAPLDDDNEHPRSKSNYFHDPATQGYYSQYHA